MNFEKKKTERCTEKKMHRGRRPVLKKRSMKRRVGKHTMFHDERK